MLFDRRVQLASSSSSLRWALSVTVLQMAGMSAGLTEVCSRKCCCVRAKVGMIVPVEDAEACVSQRRTATSKPSGVNVTDEVALTLGLQACKVTYNQQRNLHPLLRDSGLETEVGKLHMIWECQAEEEVSENVGNYTGVNGVDGADEEVRMCLAQAAA